MTKKIMSIAAVAALFTTSAVGFETVDGNLKVGTTAPAKGTIVTESGGKLIKSSYVSGVPMAADLTVSGTYKGDALIYPAYNQDGWGTEIVVRNTSGKAIVAKAVLYAGSDSREVLDFNIYLSAKDVCRFKIENGKITSSDDSIRTWGINPHQVDTSHTAEDRSDHALIEFANKTAHPFEHPVSAKSGYVVIYGMEQSDGYNGSTDGFHKKHASLYAAYAQSLQDTRTGWRNITNPATGSIKNGMFVNSVTAAPNLATPALTTFKLYSKTTKTYVDRTAQFAPVDAVLTGQVRLYNEAGRDMLLNATALNNFTDNGVMLWTEGEYASIADRRIDATGAYSAVDIVADTATFKITSAVYTYANAAGGNVANQLLMTQPYKRVLAQLGEATNNGYLGSTDAKDNKKVATGTSYSFTMGLAIWDEAENQNEEALAGAAIISPRTTGAETVAFNKEVQDINATQLEGLYPGVSKDKNGFVDITGFTIPAIVTQMSASMAGTSAETNWVYADTVK